jgi:hypothetical protein
MVPVRGTTEALAQGGDPPHSSLFTLTLVAAAVGMWATLLRRPSAASCPQPSCRHCFAKRSIAGGRVEELVAHLKSVAGGERLLVCYEAGYDGFWLARSLTSRGIACRVLDPASLQVNRRVRRARAVRAAPCAAPPRSPPKPGKTNRDSATEWGGSHATKVEVFTRKTTQDI